MEVSGGAVETGGGQSQDWGSCQHRVLRDLEADFCQSRGKVYQLDIGSKPGTLERRVKIATRLSSVSWVAKVGVALVPLGLAFMVQPEGEAVVRVEDEPTFARDVLPVLKANCGSCHGAETAYSDLRLDSYQALMKGGLTEGTVIPGDSEKSDLIRRMRGLDGKEQMPKGFRPIDDATIDKIAEWIDLGAKNDGGDYVHWAYVPPVRPDTPDVKQADWVRNPIDAFILARLEEEGLKPSPEASKETLVRRVYLDVLGLPPTPEEARAFLEDESPDAYEKMVDRVFASPHYGERQARIWLDLARYADSQGYEKDANRSMWPWRDWVIEAFNANMSFDDFTIDQFAGDLLANATVDQIVATGFHRNTMINEEGGVDQGEARWLTQVDRVGTVGTVWLGSTLACAQCHDHKYDPVSQKEFYQFLAYFENTKEPRYSLTPEVEKRQNEIQNQIQKINGSLQAVGPTEEEKEKMKAELAKLQEEFKGLKNITTLVLMDAEGGEPKTPIREKGMYLSPGEVVEASTPAVMGPKPSPDVPVDRLSLAEWLVSPENPLTARVQVNRFWEQHFGMGIVKTMEDFGTQASDPSHPELLDWLAVEFMDNGWDMKAMHKLIVMSTTYRQESHVSAELLERDPENALLARGPRFRLEAEAIRDSVFAVSDLLTRKIGGPSVMPVQPDGLWDNPYSGETWVNATGEDRYRRSVYTFIKRSSPFPMLLTFDGTSREACTPKRIRTNTPLQALNMLNDPGLLEGAVALAKLVKSGSGGTEEKIEDLVFRCLVREARPIEQRVLGGLYSRNLARYKKDLAAAKKLTGSEDAELAAWTLVINVLMNTDEFLTLE